MYLFFLLNQILLNITQNGIKYNTKSLKNTFPEFSFLLEGY